MEIRRLRNRRTFVRCYGVTLLIASVLIPTQNARADWYFAYTDAVATNTPPIGVSVDASCRAKYADWRQLYVPPLQSRYLPPDPIAQPSRNGAYQGEFLRTSGNCRHEMWSPYSSPPQWLAGSFAAFAVDWRWCNEPAEWLPLSQTCEQRKVYVSSVPPPQRGCSSNGVGDPIDPSSCRAYGAHIDIASQGDSGIEFKRFYNSNEASGGWRHSFSRRIKLIYSGSRYREYAQNPDNSSLYDTEQAACTDGFSEIKSRVSTWGVATASYSNGVCTLTVGATVIGTLSIFHRSHRSLTPATMVLIGLDATRDDGGVVSFTVNGSSITAPPGGHWSLQQTATGYVLKDRDDATESYDASGRLLSVVSRASVTQNLSYDAAGRLSAVTDSFGGKLILTYDDFGRLKTVARQ